MKTFAKISLTRISVALLLSGFVGASAFAGPGPQFWARSAANRVSTGNSGSDQACGGCSTTVTYAHHDRGPAGVGAQAVSVVATQHACTRCGGATIAAKETLPVPMVAASSTCGAMVCCR